MQHYRRITSLQEDFEKIGISSRTFAQPAGPQRGRALTEADDEAEPEEVAEDDETAGEGEEDAGADAEQTTEGLQRVKTHKMKSGDKAKARQSARKNKAANNRKRRMDRKKSGYKRRMTKLAKAKKGKKAGGRMRFKLVQGMDRAANVLESLDVRRLVESTEPGKRRAQLADSMMKIAGLAGALGRRFAVLESCLLDEESNLGLPVMHAASAYGWDSEDSFIGGKAPKTGDATDYVDGSAPAVGAPSGEQMEDDEDPVDDGAETDEATLIGNPGSGETEEGIHVGNPSNEDDEDPIDDVDMDLDADLDMDDEEGCDADADADMGDDLDMGDTDDAGDEYDDEEDDDELESYEGRKAPRTPGLTERANRNKRGIYESISLPMDHELAAIRVEATEVALNLQQGNVSMGQASDLMGDMVSYLGGAMKLYNQLVAYQGELEALGQGNPPQAGGDVPNVVAQGTVIGNGMPEGGTPIAMPTPAGGAKTGDAIDGSAKGGPAATATQESRTGKKPKALGESDDDDFLPGAIRNTTFDDMDVGEASKGLTFRYDGQKYKVTDIQGDYVIVQPIL